jgi:hypothetical protein
MIFVLNGSPLPESAGLDQSNLCECMVLVRRPKKI